MSCPKSAYLLIVLYLMTDARSFVCADEGLRDPFTFETTQAAPAPVVVVVVEPKRSRLIGVLWDAKNPLALIDGEPVRIGQQVKGWRVIAIQPNSVVIQRGDRKETLTTGDSIPAE